MAQVTVEMETVDLRDAANRLVTGPHVDNLQGLLKGTLDEDWDPGPIDGQGGPRTRAAVVAFQAANSLDPDAVVGPLTWGVLIPFPSSPAASLPPDGFPRTPAVDVTGAFAVLAAQPTFEAFVAEVIAAVERLHPQEPGAEAALRTDSASASAGTVGAVLVRRTGFLDDSVAGQEYEVSAGRTGAGWVIRSATRSTICRRGVSGSLCV